MRCWPNYARLVYQFWIGLTIRSLVNLAGRRIPKEIGSNYGSRLPGGGQSPEGTRQTSPGCFTGCPSPGIRYTYGLIRDEIGSGITINRDEVSNGSAMWRVWQECADWQSGHYAR